MPSKYASGKHSIAECDRCGQRYKLKELKKQGQQLHTYSIGMNDGTDIKYARIAAKEFGVKLHEIILTEDDVIVLKTIQHYAHDQFRVLGNKDNEQIIGV